MAYILAILGGYLMGCSNMAYWLAKGRGVDLRSGGSGNLGASNAVTMMGWKAGVITALHDGAKAFLAVLLFRFVFRDVEAIGTVAGVAAVYGHIFPFYLKFKGGKGISTAAGAVLALNPPALLASGIVWAALFFAFRYVSLASIFAAALLPVFAWGAGKLGLWNVSDMELALFILLGVLAIVKHISNIKRLLNGTESRFVKKKDNTENGEK